MTIGEAVYVGEWQRDTKHGTGTLSLPSGARYEGQVRRRRRVWRLDSRRTRSLQWEFDGRCGQGVFEDAFGVTYVGAWKDNKRHGAGVEFQLRARGDGARSLLFVVVVVFTTLVQAKRLAV